MVTVWIDEFVPCLKDSLTGEIVDTEVVQATRKSFLSKYNKKTGWHTNWGNLLEENEVYALVLKGTDDIQGLIALKRHDEALAVNVSWMCASPANDPTRTSTPRYVGIGGHLFSIAVDKSFEYGYDGVIEGIAANRKLLDHYCEVFGAELIGMTHDYQFAIFEDQAKKIREVYTYEWTDTKL